MNYQKLGLDKAMVERTKKKLKKPEMKEQLKLRLENITKTDLQDPMRVRALLREGCELIGETMSEEQTERIIRFVLEQQIDPNSKLHMIRLWSRLR